jgi:hypothetical protein
MPLTERNTNISRTGEGARAGTGAVAEGKENRNTPKQKTPVKNTKTAAGIIKTLPRRSRTQRRGRSQRRGRGRN